MASRPEPAARLPLHLAPGSGEPAYALLERLSRRYGAGSPAAFAGEPSPARLVEPAEAALFAALEEAHGRIEAALSVEDFAGAMAALARLRPAVDAFFDTVLVNAPEAELRANRLRMLGQIRAGLQRVADFSLIEEVGRAAAA